MIDIEKSLQDQFDPNGICFGCGPANKKGLRIKSMVEGDHVVLRYTPAEHHQAFKGAINGGIIGALFDCHCNWTGAFALYKEHPDEEFPSTVTASFEVRLKRPTPYGVELLVKAKPVEIKGNKVTVEAEMYAEGKLTATCTGVFVAVKEGHIAYRRW